MEQPLTARELPWYALMTKHGAEERVAEQIRGRLDREVYLPRIEVRVKKNRRLVPAVKPLFPNYLFVRLRIPEEWRLITYTRGSLRLLGGWSHPQPVPEEIIEFIRSREREKDRLIQYYNFQAHDPVYIKTGPFKELYGIFEHYVDDLGRVKVLLSLLNYQASVILDASLIEKA